MNKDKDTNGIKDYEVRHEFQELHADNKDLCHVMNWFPHNVERLMHKSLIMISKLGITKQRDKPNCTKSQSCFECKIIDLFRFFKKRRQHGYQ